MPPMPEGLTLLEQLEWSLGMAMVYGYGLILILWKIACFIAPFAIIWLVIKHMKNR